MTDDLVVWLRVQLDGDERLARAVAGSGVWKEYIEGGDDGWAFETVPGGDPCAIVGDEAMAHHIAANDPARVLREVEAKRAVLDLWRLEFNDEGEPIFLGSGGEVYWDAIRLLALPYSDRPGYREEWRP